MSQEQESKFEQLENKMTPAEYKAAFAAVSSMVAGWGMLCFLQQRQNTLLVLSSEEDRKLTTLYAWWNNLGEDNQKRIKRMADLLTDDMDKATTVFLRQ